METPINLNEIGLEFNPEPQQTEPESQEQEVDQQPEPARESDTEQLEQVDTEIEGPEDYSPRERMLMKYYLIQSL
jgi:hypothetical protein